MIMNQIILSVATRIFVIVEISSAASSRSELSSRYDNHHSTLEITNLHLTAGYLELGLSQDRKPSGAGSQKNEAHIPPLLGVAPLGIVPLSKEHQFQYRSAITPQCNAIPPRWLKSLTPQSLSLKVFKG